MDINIGIKVWSRNTAYVPYIQSLYKAGYCNFVEVYVEAQAIPDQLKSWKELKVPVRLHAPHSYGGFNPAVNEDLEGKRRILKKIVEYQQNFHPESIVFHPGIEGSIEESIHQFGMFKKEFPGVFKAALIENKPHVGQKNETARGDTAQEIKQLMDKIDFGFCLDFGHAACYAVWAKKDWKEAVKEFMTLNPKLFHLSDGDIHSPVDTHWHLGKGNFPLKEMVDFLPDGAYLTLETPHDSLETLDDFKKDADIIRRLCHEN